jgi:hypothetical protein
MVHYSTGILRCESSLYSLAFAPLIRFVPLLYPSFRNEKNDASGRFVPAVHADRCRTVGSFCCVGSAESLSPLHERG